MEMDGESEGDLIRMPRIETCMNCGQEIHGNPNYIDGQIYCTYCSKATKPAVPES